MDPAISELIGALPKVELHLHIEGTLEPELAFVLAERNGVTLPYDDVDALRAAYDFEDLQSFLDLYYACCDVLRTEQDFYELTRAYLERARRDNVVHAEIMFDPQTHTARGIPFDAVIGGVHRALQDGEAELGITSALIMSFLRHLDEASAFETLERARPHLRLITAVGLDSAETGNPPGKFTRVFAEARALGLRVVAHAGEEGPPSYIREALDVLGAERIDHGVRCQEDAALVERLIADGIPLTVCPLSNVKLRVYDELDQHNLAALLARGVRVTINSDDPAYFGGYIGANYRAAAEALGLRPAELVTIAENAARASFASEARVAQILDRIREAAAAAAGL
jgi:adenosine deaminase